MGSNVGKLIITRRGISFEPRDDKSEAFNQPYSNIQSLRYIDEEIVVTFKSDVGEVGNEIKFKHVTKSPRSTRAIERAYNELKPK